MILTPWKREATPAVLDEANDAVVARIDAWLPGLDAPLAWIPTTVVAVAPSPIVASTAERAGSEAGV